MALGILGLPIPDESILTFAGYLISRNDLQFLPALISSVLGSITGISISFLLGYTLGARAVKKLSGFFHITEKGLSRAHKWFEGYGAWVILFGYFIPGVRHLTAIIAGSTKIKYSRFASFAYIGAFIWALTFILLGFYFGSNWDAIIKQVRAHILFLTFLLLILMASYFILKNKLSHNKSKSQDL